MSEQQLNNRAFGGARIAVPALLVAFAWRVHGVARRAGHLPARMLRLSVRLLSTNGCRRRAAASWGSEAKVAEVVAAVLLDGVVDGARFHVCALHDLEVVK